MVLISKQVTICLVTTVQFQFNIYFSDINKEKTSALGASDELCELFIGDEKKRTFLINTH